MLVPVILAGGVGTRLWPQSRALLPKQFIEFPGQDGSLFQGTLSRLRGLEPLGAPIVICNADHRFLVAEQLRQLDIVGSSLLLEPVGRNTAPAVAMAALSATAGGEDPILLVLPADHLISNQAALHEAIRLGEQVARQDRLVTFGIVPDSPETGYGYIRKGAALEDSEVFQVARFVEKPDLETARAYLESGDYLWNSGMFLFRASVFLAELQAHQPQMLNCCREAFAALATDQDYQRIPEPQFAACPADSIDYAVMEKTAAAAMVPLDADWNDLGAWTAIWEVAEKDGNGNAISGDVLLEQVSNSYIQAGSRVVAAVGIQDTVIIETSDAVLVAGKDQVQGIKKIVAMLEAAERHESQHHDLVFRPWGSYRSLENAEGYQVKHIIVNPGQALSLQMHHHRAEHWTIVRGEALVTRDDEVHRLGGNESIFLPLGCRHRLENRGQEPVELIEVQLGSYLGEDDIVRFDDVYGRVDKT
ncbi:MAG: mannose-1-phosphate guanylyltransferase/mannose-6-phosphate isomerase [Pseudomonadales bacterium]|nr:mannose-1-phosphate guanylyltransferase/mannose-6-phosphate isomerase [Pseudomonadales bacterium]